MKLYFSPSACSLSPHIVLREAGIAFELEKVHLGTKKTASGKDFRAVNPKGYVPALELDNGEVLTEGPAIVQYVADQRPDARLAPAAGSFERYRLVEWLNFISTEIHKGMAVLFNPKLTDEEKQAKKDALTPKFEYLAKALEGRQHLMGDFSVADAYLFTVLRWTGMMAIDLSRWPALTGYMERVGQRPAVKAALEAESK